MHRNLIEVIKLLFPKLPFSILTSSREEPLAFDFHFTLMLCATFSLMRPVYLWLRMKSVSIPEA